MKIVCLILNYNDAATAGELARRIYGYACLDHILLVDNASTDDSLAELEKLSDARVTVLKAPRNGGYGAGNNLGVRYAAEHLGATQVLIANPDVSFTESCVRKLAGLFRRHPEMGAVAARMEQQGLGRYESAWPLHGFVRELLYMGPVSRRLFRRQVYYPDSYFQNKKAVWVDVVHGSMLMVSAEAFLACGGYDENVFLYQEEAILAKRMKRAGFRTALLLTESYRHCHSASRRESLAGELARQRQREKSVSYYLKNYLSAGAGELLAARVWFRGIRMEIRLYWALRSRKL